MRVYFWSDFLVVSIICFRFVSCRFGVGGDGFIF